MFAEFEIRRMDLPVARKVLGAAIGTCPKEKLFKVYIQLEIDVSDFVIHILCTILRVHDFPCQFRELDRARILFEKHFEVSPVIAHSSLYSIKWVFISTSQTPLPGSNSPTSKMSSETTRALALSSNPLWRCQKTSGKPIPIFNSNKVKGTRRDNHMRGPWCWVDMWGSGFRLWSSKGAAYPLNQAMREEEEEEE